MCCGFGLAIIEQLGTRVERALSRKASKSIFNQFATLGPTLVDDSYLVPTTNKHAINPRLRQGERVEGEGESGEGGNWPK